MRRTYVSVFLMVMSVLSVSGLVYAEGNLASRPDRLETVKIDGPLLRAVHVLVVVLHVQEGARVEAQS